MKSGELENTPTANDTHENTKGSGALPEIPRKVPMQPASLDIWDSKYRLKTKAGEPVDQSLDDTWRRIARTLADIEAPDVREHWYGRFLWALRRGAIPAGRIVSNAGALDYKPATSTINCTVSETIHDSMDDILGKVHKAGMTLKSGAGIGYCFSTLRPRGAWVAGAGAQTSGPLSFMDIYDRMCFTISSAGGRRGAQMGTFDIGHPDVEEFIRAKREDGRLRQFNLSLLVTEEFMEQVKADGEWKLAFPVTAGEAQADGLDLDDPDKVVWRPWEVHEGYVVRESDGLVAHRVYRTVRARHLWNMIMASTYDYAEPGFLLIDEGNRQNNNWFCENIRATNPCVTADTRLATQYGMVPIGELHRRGVPLEVTADRRILETGGRGTEARPAVPAFMTAREADVYRVTTVDGYEIKATEWHGFFTRRGRVELRDLRVGDELLVQSGKGQFGCEGSEDLGLLLGFITGDGHFTRNSKGQEMACAEFWGEKKALATPLASYINTLIAGASKGARTYRVAPCSIPERDELSIRSALLARALEHYGFSRRTKLQVPEVVWRGSEDCVRGYLRALFQADGTVNVSGGNTSCSIRLASSHPGLLKEVQTLLANFGVFSRIRLRRAAGKRNLPDGKGGEREYHCKADHDLIIDGESREVFMREIGFLLDRKNGKYHAWAQGKALRKRQRFATRVAGIVHVGREPVFDTTQPDHNTVIFNGLVTAQCGEQMLPPAGSCLLGSVNLTRFVEDPFTDRARFDWDTFEEVVAVFTRMLDNVVEINGLPLQAQRDEITRKRRHGMGFLGLGSAMTMLGLRYGEDDSLAFTEDVACRLAVTGWRVGVELAKEKGPAPIMDEEFEVTPEMMRRRPEMADDGISVGDRVPGRVLHARYSRYMARIAGVDPSVVDAIAEHGARFTHHTSIAPTGTIALSLANNASNGIEPSFAHHYARNVIRQGRKAKEKVDVFSFEMLAYRELVNPEAMPGSDDPGAALPAGFITADDVTPKQHVAVQAAAQKWVDSSISKTANVPTDYPYEDFKDIYLYAYEAGLKGCTTFRFNPEVFQGVLVKNADLANTTYEFTLEDGTRVSVRGDEEVEYEGEVHTAANLYDALKEGTYGKY